MDHYVYSKTFVLLTIICVPLGEHSNICPTRCKLHSLFYLETSLRVSGGTTTHHQGGKQLYLKHLVFATPLLLPAAIAAGSSYGVTMLLCYDDW